jgi:hypothetical protein
MNGSLWHQRLAAPIVKPIVGLAMLATGLAVWHTALAWGQTWSAAGDPYAAYFPTAQALLHGHFLDGFAPLHRGQARMPLFSTLIAVTALVTPSLQVAAQVVNIAAWAATFFLVGLALLRLGSPEAVVPAWVAFLASPWMTHTAAEALPDALFGLTVTAALVALYLAWSQDRPRAFFWVGLLCGLVIETRFNGFGIGLWVPIAILLLGRGRPRARELGHYGGGLALALLPLFVLALWLDTIQGVSYPSFYFNQHNLVGQPDMGTGSIARSAIGGALALPGRLVAAGIHPALLILATATFAIAAIRVPTRRSTIAVLGGLALLMGALAPMHFEARYWVPFAPAIIAATGLGLAWLLRRPPHLAHSRAGRVALMSGLAALLLGPGVAAGMALRERRFLASADADRLCRALERAAPQLPVAVGVAPKEFYYNRQRGCELVAGRPVYVLPAEPGTVGPGLELAGGGNGLGTLATVFGETGADTISRSDEYLKLEDAPRLSPAGEGVHELHLPHPVAPAKRRHTVTLHPTTGRLPAVIVRTPANNGLLLEVSIADRTSKLLVATFGESKRLVLAKQYAPEVTVTFGPADPLRPGEPILVRFEEASPTTAAW